MSIFYIEDSSINNFYLESGGVRKKIAQNYMTTAKNTGNNTYISKAMNIAQPSKAKEKIEYQVNPDNWKDSKEVKTGEYSYGMSAKKGKPYELSNKTPNFKSKSPEEQKAIVDEGRRRKQEIRQKYYK